MPRTEQGTKLATSQAFLAKNMLTRSRSDEVLRSAGPAIVEKSSNQAGHFGRSQGWSMLSKDRGLMKRLLRNLDTGAFFKRQDDWTLDPDDAMDFPDDRRAVRAAEELGLKNLELLILAENGGLLFATPVTTGIALPRLNIMIVDDDPLMHMLYQRHLFMAGYEVMTAMNGAEAMNAAARTKPALILMDIMMPGMDGLSTLREFAKNEGTRDVPVIIITAGVHNYSSSREAAKFYGAAGFLTKPFSPAHLLAEIRRLIPG